MAALCLPEVVVWASGEPLSASRLPAYDRAFLEMPLVMSTEKFLANVANSILREMNAALDEPIAYPLSPSLKNWQTAFAQAYADRKPVLERHYFDALCGSWEATQEQVRQYAMQYGISSSGDQAEDTSRFGAEVLSLTQHRVIARAAKEYGFRMPGESADDD